MRQEPCKTHGHLFPADGRVLDAVNAVLADWNIPECTELEGDIFRISFDLIDMENWTLTRAAFSGAEITTKTVGLNHVLAYSGH